MGAPMQSNERLWTWHRNPRVPSPYQLHLVTSPTPLAYSHKTILKYPPKVAW